MDILRRSSVIILTPDVIHAWLLNNVSEKAVLTLLKHPNLRYDGLRHGGYSFLSSSLSAAGTSRETGGKSRKRNW